MTITFHLTSHATHTTEMYDVTHGLSFSTAQLEKLADTEHLIRRSGVHGILL